MMNETTIGFGSDRLSYLAETCEELARMCRQPLSTRPDIFGEVETWSGREFAIRRAAERVSKIAATTDEEWDRLNRETAAEVREADHPKHSVLPS